MRLSEKSDSFLNEYILVISHLIKEIIVYKLINRNVALAHSLIIPPDSPGFSRIGGLVSVCKIYPGYDFFYSNQRPWTKGLAKAKKEGC
jgi:hypothetical protein